MGANGRGRPSPAGLRAAASARRRFRNVVGGRPGHADLVRVFPADACTAPRTGRPPAHPPAGEVSSCWRRLSGSAATERAGRRSGSGIKSSSNPISGVASSDLKNSPPQPRMRAGGTSARIRLFHRVVAIESETGIPSSASRLSTSLAPRMFVQTIATASTSAVARPPEPCRRCRVRRPRAKAKLSLKAAVALRGAGDACPAASSRL